MQVRLVLFGGFQARLSSGATLGVPTKKARALLAYLALRPGQAQPRDKLATLLWADSGDAQARTSLRQSLATLRRSLGSAAPSSLRIEGNAVTLNPDAVAVDVEAFERLLVEETPEALEQAVGLYRGELLEGLDVRAAPFEEWLLAERERLRELALEAQAKLLRHQSDAGATEPAIQTALRLLALDPLQEAVHRTLMRLYARQRRRANALRQFQVCVGVLQRELGVEPEPETRQLYQDILQQRADSGSKPEPTPAPARRRRRGPARARRGAAGFEPPLVGRQAEVARLHQALDEAGAGSGRAVVILGEAGIGKTRLLEELASAVLQRGGRPVVGRCYETEQILPFGPWVEALRAGLAARERDTLQGLDPVWRAELARLLPELADPGLTPAGPADDYLRLFGAVAWVIQHVAAESPLVLIVEDLHWADEMSVRLFGFLARRVEGWPVLLVASAREEELDGAPLLRQLLEELRGGRHFVPLALAPLSRPETHSLVRVLARVETREAALDRLAGQVWTVSEGNPFVAVETIRALQEGHQLAASTSALPDRVRQVIGGRLDRLSARAREVLAVAAVIGRELEFALLQRAAGSTERETAEGLEELVRRRVLHGVGERFDFTHDRVREVAYGQLLPPRRRLLHAAVGDALEAVYADNLEPHHAALALHYRQGQVWGKALGYLRRAGARAVACSANREAIACFEQALEALEHLPESRSRMEQAYDLRLEVRNALVALGELARNLGHLREAETFAEALGDRRRLGWVSGYTASQLWLMGQLEEAVEAGQRALAIATESDDLELQATARLYLGASYHALGDYCRAIECLRWLVESLEDGRVGESRVGLGLVSVLSRAWLVWCLSETGRFADGIEHGRQALRIAEEANHPASLVFACRSLGLAHLRKGEFDRAVPALERAVEVCRIAHLRAPFDATASFLGYAYALGGRAAEAVPLMEQAVSDPASTGSANHPLFLVHLGEAHLLAGHADQAAAVAQRGLDLARRQKERGHEAWGLRLLGEIAARRDPADVEAAEQRYRDGLARAGELGMRPLAAHCHLGLGTLHSRAGDCVKAREHLTTAATLYREMDMGSWLARAEAMRPGP